MSSLIRVSILVPTRGRVEQLCTMLSTLYSTASDLTRVEVIARIDEDDQPTIEYLDRLPQVKKVCKTRVGYAKNAQMVNECAAQATGNLLLVANDDLIFETPDWDVKLETAAARYPDGLFDLGVDTVLNNANFCFPCTSQKTVSVLGFFFDDRLLYPDIWLRDVMLPFNRAIRVPEVTIRHAWRGMTEDQMRAVSVARADPNYDALYARCVEEGRRKIEAAMREFVCR